MASLILDGLIQNQRRSREQRFQSSHSVPKLRPALKLRLDCTALRPDAFPVHHDRMIDSACLSGMRIGIG